MEKHFKFEEVVYSIVTDTNADGIKYLIDTAVDFCRSLSTNGIDLIHVRVRITDVAQVWFANDPRAPAWEPSDVEDLIIYPDGSFSFCEDDDFTEPVVWENEQ